MIINESQQVNLESEAGYLNYYPFDSNWILKQRFNWEINTQIASSRKFDQIALLNQSVDREECNQTIYYVHGPKYKDLINIETIKRKANILEPALIKKMPDDATVRHTRNQNIKDQLFYD